MHGFSSGPIYLINAEVDSMGGVVDGGVGIDTKPSPRRAAIEKAQAELRLEYDVREERRRELEFLEKGGDPLDFKFGHAASLSVQSTSRTDQHPDQILTSEAKGSFALTASTHGDSVESSGRLGVTTACEPNSADNFDGENEILQSDRKSMHPVRGSTALSEQSSQFDGRSNVKESEDSSIFPKKGQAYRRRNRTRMNRDGPRSSSADMASRGGHCSSMPGRHGILPKPVTSENQLEVESDGTHLMHSYINSRASEFAEGKKHKKLVEKREEAPSLKVDDDNVATATVEPVPVAGSSKIDTVDVECPPCSIVDKTADIGASAQLSETRMMNGDGKCTPLDALINNAPVLTKGLDSESSCSHTNVTVDGNGATDSVLYTCLKNVNSNGDTEEQKLPVQEKSVSREEKRLEKYNTNSVETSSCVKEDQSSIGHQGNGFAERDQDENDRGRSSQGDESKVLSEIEEQEKYNLAGTKLDNELSHCTDSTPKKETSCPVRLLPSLNPSLNEPNKTDVSAQPPFSEPQPSTDNRPKPLDKAQEDNILEKARIIEAKHKRIAELSNNLLPREHRRKCQWDFVLEEMAWLANDFAQERLWKLTAAAHICHRVAFSSRRRLEEQNKYLKQKSVAHRLSKAVMDFWQSARFSVENADVSQVQNRGSETSSGAVETELSKCKAEISTEDKASPDVLTSARRKQDLAVHRYAVRFLQLNCSSKPLMEVEVSRTPDVACDIDLPEVLWQDQLTEENLFYAVPPGAMEMYRKSIESSLVDDEMVGNNIQEEVDTSAYDAAADNDCEEDEGENLYYQPGAFDTSKQSKKKRKYMKYAARPFEYGGDLGYGHSVENKNGTPQSAVLGKRPSNSLSVDPIPTKRMRTASRQRLVSPFGAGPASAAPVLSRADASSGDTNSFQDDHSTLHGGSMFPRGSEVDSTMNFEKQSAYDSADIAAKPKKKKKIKHQSVTYDQRWQAGSSMHSEQKDHMRKRLDNQQFESNGNSGLFGQHAKRPKTMRHSLDTSFDNMLPASGSVASPVASQMSNMSSQNKIIKFYGGRDRGRKAKGVKVPAGQLGSGNPWTVYEDQALVVLVHDMGPNWALVSDAINSMLQFKCIFRKPQDCKERHKCLMESTSGDGADSAEDSGSSQPYPSTLPGIPKGSARQLFRSLHAPVVEDNIKSHFEKIIRIGQQLHYRRKQNDNQDLKQLAAVHGSHVIALSQVIPNNVSGGVLTPLDLCDIATSNQDQLSIGYQNSHAGGLPLPSQGSVASMHPPSGLNSSLHGLQGSPGMGNSNNPAPPSSQFAGARDARFSLPRATSLPVEEQQRLHQYNSMLPGRNGQPSNLSSSGSLSGNDRGVRVLPGGNGVGIIPGMNRSMPMVRPGLHGIPSSSMLNSESMLASNMGGMPSNMNVPGQGNTVFRSRDALHKVRPGQNPEHQRQLVSTEMQMQATQSNSPCIPFGGLSSGFSNQSASSPLQTYPGHQQQQHPTPQQHPHVHSSTHPHLPNSNHSANPEQQAYLRRARERQIQQRILQRQQQHQQQSASSALMTHVQTPSELPMSSSTQSGSQLQSPSSSQSLSLPSLSPSAVTHVSAQPQQQQKHHLTSQGIGRSPQTAGAGMVNQVGKQRQRQAQQLQQSGRQHPLQRQQSQSQQAKLLKGNGRSNLLMHQNLPIDPSHLNGLLTNTGSAEKGEPAVHLMQSQGLYPGSGLTAVTLSKSQSSPQTSSHTPPQKTYLNTGPATSKPVQQISPHLDGGTQGQAPQVPSTPTTGCSNQGLPSMGMPSHNYQQVQGQPQPPVKVKQSQRATQQNHQVNADSSTKSLVDHSSLEQYAVDISSSGGLLPASVESANPVTASSSASIAVQKVQEAICDSSVNSESSPSGLCRSPALSVTAGNEPIPSVSQCPSQRQLSGHEAQWQQQQSQLQPTPLRPILPQKQSLQQRQQLEQPPQRALQPQPQPQIQAGKTTVFTRPPNSRLE